MHSSRLAAAILATVVTLAAPARGGPVTISEVLYDVPGSDDGSVFVELYGPPGVDLLGFELLGLNGKGGGVTHRIALSGLVFPQDGFLVLADELRGGGTLVGASDAVFGNLDLQNGPDSVQLLFGGQVVDALGYGSFGPTDVFGGEGLPASGGPPGWSVARRFADLDTDRNDRDFLRIQAPTPGSGRLFAETPEPGTLLLLGGGLTGLYFARRRVVRSARERTTEEDRRARCRS